MKFFVYGTLKRGFPNARFIPDKHIQSAVPARLKGFDMYSTGAFPAIIRGEGVSQGELITLKSDAPAQEILRSVDQLENEGRMYRRETLPVITKSGDIEEAYVYVWLYETTRLKRIKDNIWHKR
ncbi:AIG2-like family protein [Peptococcaceae bacterium CEB3]|nr:AIG2-like family protein [Peptococcaceae bacterium CEB3]